MGLPVSGRFCAGSTAVFWFKKGWPALNATRVQPIESDALINDDLAPTTPVERTWSMWHIAALWVGMAGWQATLTVMLGNVIVLLPMIFNGHPGTQYGVPFPVLVRSSFGTVGAHVPSIARGLVACGWFGIQCWIGGAAIYSILDAVG